MNKYILLFSFLLFFGIGFSALDECGLSISNCCAINNSATGLTYSLASDVVNADSLNLSCITINISNATLNLSGYSVSNPMSDAFSSTFYAINVSNANNVTIANGRVNNSGGLLSSSAYNLTIRNVSFYNLSTGVYLLRTSHSNLYNNTFNRSGFVFSLSNYTSMYSSSFYGVHKALAIVGTVHNISFITNTINACDYGVYVNPTSGSLSDSNVTDNNISYCYYGTYFSSRTNISNNNFTNTFYSMLFGSEFFEFMSDYLNTNLLINNTFDGKLMVNYQNQSGLTIDSDDNATILILYNVSNSIVQNFGIDFSGAIGLYNCVNVTLKNITLNYSGDGIYIVNSANATLNSSTIGLSDVPTGKVDIRSSNDTTIEGTSIAGATDIYISDGDRTSILSNTLLASANITTWDVFGTSFYSSDNVSFSNNVFSYSLSNLPNNVSGRSTSYTRFGTNTGSEINGACNHAYYAAVNSDASNKFNFTSNNFSDFQIGVWIGDSNGSFYSNNFQNLTAGTILVDSNVSFASNYIASIINTINPEIPTDCYYQYFRQLWTNNSYLDFANNNLSGKNYTMAFSGLLNISINSSALSGSAPYQSSLDQLVDLANVSPGASVNLTMHYSNSNLDENTAIRMYKYNGSWANLADLAGVTCSQNTTADSFTCNNITSFSTFGLFGKLSSTQPPDPPDQTRLPIVYSSASACLSNGNRELTITTKDRENNPLSAVDAFIFDSTRPENTKSGSTNSSGLLSLIYTPDEFGTYRVLLSKSGNYQSYEFSVTLSPCEQPPQDECSTNGDCSSGCCQAGSCETITGECGYQSGCEWLYYECCSDSDCPQGEVCSSHECIIEPECESDSDCAYDEYCLQGVCKLIEGECGYIQKHKWVNYECCSDTECIEGYECKYNVCTKKEIQIEEPNPEAPRLEEQLEGFITWLDENKTAVIIILIILVGGVASYMYLKKMPPKKGYKGYNK